MSNSAYTNSGYYDLISNFLAPRPEEVEGLNNSSYFYYRRQLYTILHSIFDFKGYPDNWNIDYLYDHLFTQGYMIITDSSMGPVPLIGGFAGYNVYRFPTDTICANPVLGNVMGKIGVSSEILYFNRLDDTFIPAEPLIKRYALLLAQCDASMNVTLMNSRVAHVFRGKNDAEVKSLQKMYDEVSQGKPAVFLKKNDPINGDEKTGDFMNVKNTFIGMELTDTKRSIMNEFLTQIGINNANTDKRERLNSDEVNANNSEIMACPGVWLHTMQRCLERVNKTLGLNVSVELNDEVIRKIQQDPEEGKDEPD